MNTAYEYDLNGKLVKEYWYWASGELGYTVVYEYDDRGYISKRYRYNADGTLASTVL